MMTRILSAVIGALLFSAVAADAGQITITGGAPPTTANPLFINVADYADITGNIDSASTLNALFDTICTAGNVASVLAPSGTIVKVNSTVVIKNCNNRLIVDFNWGTLIWGGAAHGGPVLQIDGVQTLDLKNIDISMNGADVGLDIDEINGGITSDDTYTNIKIFGGNLAANSAFIGIRMGVNAPGNLDRQKFEHMFIYCGDAPGGGLTATSNGSGVALVDHSLAEPFWTYFHDTQANNCSNAYYIGVGTNATEWDIDGGYGGGNFHELNAAGGQVIRYRNIHSEDASEVPIVASAFSLLDISGNDFDGLSSGQYIQATGGGTLSVTNNLFKGGTAKPVTSTNGSGLTVLKSNRVQAGTSCFDLSGIGGRTVAEGNMPQSGLPCAPFNNTYPTSCTSQPTGSIWVDTGVLKQCP